MESTSDAVLSLFGIAVPVLENALQLVLPSLALRLVDILDDSGILEHPAGDLIVESARASEERDSKLRIRGGATAAYRRDARGSAACGIPFVAESTKDGEGTSLVFRYSFA